jgi:hypothetical protein
MHLYTWGGSIGKLNACWYDLWERHFCLEVNWGTRMLFCWA